MSATSAMAAMLDELMGPKRNDPDICKYYLVAFCPHDMFINTKSDLGVCPKVHDDNLKRDYPTSDKFEKLGFERDFLRFLIRLEDDNQRRIRKNREKLKSNDEYGQKRDEEKRRKDTEELGQVDEDIRKTVIAAEEAGNRGEVILSHELVQKLEIMEKSRESIMARLDVNTPADIDDGSRQKDVCDVCGSMLIRNDAQCRVEEHLLGKMHMGFAKIQVTIEELKERMRKRGEEESQDRDKKRKERATSFDRVIAERERSGGATSDHNRGDRKERSDRRRSRERDTRDNRRHSRDRDQRRERSRSRERYRRDDGGRDRDRRSRR